MGKLLELVLFGAGGIVGLVWFSTVILSLFYGIPKSTYHVVNGALRGVAVLHYLFFFALWFSAFVGVVVFIAVYLPTLHETLTQSQGFTAGQIVGVLYGLIRAATTSGRADLRNDFWSVMTKYFRSDKKMSFIEGLPVSASELRDVLEIPSDAMEIIGVYAKVVAEQFAKRIENPCDSNQFIPVSMLPYSKKAINQAIETALQHAKDPEMHQSLLRMKLVLDYFVKE